MKEQKRRGKKTLEQTLRDVQTPSKLQVYLVGGAVRDALLGKKPKDMDFLVTGTSDEQMEELGFKRVGRSVNAPVYLHPETGDEFALARREQDTDRQDQDGHGSDHAGYHGFEFDTEDVSIEEDLERRDLTINAIAYDPVNEAIIDPHGGLEDLRSRTLRHVSKAFAEDPLRVLRTARFVARLREFDIAKSTKELMKETAPRLKGMPVERFTQELQKLFKEAHSPRQFFDILMAVDAMQYFWPELARMEKRPAGPDEYHGNNTVYEHTMQAIESAHERDPNNTAVLLAALTHDLGKTRTPDENLPHHYEHEQIGAEMADDIADRLRFPTEWRRVMRHAARDHLKVPKLPKLKATTALRVGRRLIRDHGLGADEFLNVAHADKESQPGQTAGISDDVKREVRAIKTIHNSIGGEHVKREHPDIDPSAQGEHFGEVLRMERVQVLQAFRALNKYPDEFTDTGEALDVADTLCSDHDLNQGQFDVLLELCDIPERLQQAYNVCQDIDGRYIQSHYPDVRGSDFGDKLRKERLRALNSLHSE